MSIYASLFVIASLLLSMEPEQTLIEHQAHEQQRKFKAYLQKIIRKADQNFLQTNLCQISAWIKYMVVNGIDFEGIVNDVCENSVEVILEIL